MSEGPRITLAQADAIVAGLLQQWGDTLEVVGSVRRRRETVGDIELIAPLPSGWSDKRITAADDPLFATINATMSNKLVDEAPVILFGAPAPAPVTETKPIGSIIRGLKPGFRAASLKVEAWGGRVTVPVQVYRYTPENRGWVELCRTGPSEFGKAFLYRWKTKHGIPTGDDKQASVEGHLVDVLGKVVRTPTEQEAFALCGLPYADPEKRDEIAAAWARGMGAKQ